MAWNAVGMLVVMEFSPKGMVGKGTGLVLSGFLLALSAVISFKIPPGSTIES